MALLRGLSGRDDRAGLGDYASLLGLAIRGLSSKRLLAAAAAYPLPLRLRLPVIRALRPRLG